MKKCRITVLKTLLLEDLRDEYAPKFGTCPVLKQGEVYTTGGHFGEGMPQGFCEYAWQAIQIIAVSLARGGKAFGEDFNIACCNDGIRPVIFKLEAVDE